jgi:hypothetical protein
VAPVITSCAGAGGSSLKVDWTWPTSGNGSDPATGFEVRFSTTPARTALVIGPALRTATPTDLNNVSGQVWVVAVNGGATSAQSNHYQFSGNGGNRTCSPV